MRRLLFSLTPLIAGRRLPPAAWRGQARMGSRLHGMASRAIVAEVIAAGPTVRILFAPSTESGANFTQVPKPTCELLLLRSTSIKKPQGYGGECAIAAP
jgi:hypothetical protein